MQSTNTFSLVRPMAGSAASSALPQGTDHVLLSFDTGSVNAERSGNDLSFVFDDASRVTIEDFFVTGGKPLPQFVLESGETISGADLLAGIDGQMDLQTAAGPAGNSSSASGGSGDYADDPGSLIDGVSRLGSLGTEGWARSTVAPELTQADAIVTADAGPAALTDEPRLYTMRGILYTHDQSGAVQQLSMGFGNGAAVAGYVLMDANGNPVANAPFTLALVNGVLVVTLNSGAGPLEEDFYCVITVRNANGSVTEHIAQIHLDSDATFDSASKDAADIAAGLMDPSGLAHGEWHSSHTDVNAPKDMNVSSSNLGDEFVLTDHATGVIHSNDGDDVIKGTNVGGAAGAMAIYAGAGEDSIAITGHASGSIISGDTETLAGTAKGGDDSITLGSMDSGAVYGDAVTMLDTAHGGNDTIKIGDVSGGAVYGDARDMKVAGTKGGDDLIHIDKLSNATVSGDGDIIVIQGGNDTIYIKEMESGKVAGDVGAWTGQEGFGNDTITVDVMKGGVVAGDVAGESWGPGVSYPYWEYNTGNHGKRELGGHDDIRIGRLEDGTVAGDVGNQMNGRTHAGNDTISVEVMTGGAVFGDAAQAGMGGSDKFHGEGGHDLITVNEMSGGEIFGDTRTLWSNHGGQAGRMQAGDDTITVNTMSGGAIYGDTAWNDGGWNAGVSHGSDVITVGYLAGNGAQKIIDGGANTAKGWETNYHNLWDGKYNFNGTDADVEGRDVFFYTHHEGAQGHMLELQENASGDNTANWRVAIDGDDNYHDATIVNFEGIGGGMGNDTLIGNSGDNILIGGGGSDMLTGGGGADTFIFRQEDIGYGNSVNTITDFNMSEGDKLDLSSLLGGMSPNDSIGDYLTVSTFNSNKIIEISSKGAGGPVDMTIELQNRGDIDDSVLIQHILSMTS